MSRYAADTSVSVERSKGEIEKTLTRYGADEFVSGWRDSEAVVGFKMGGRQVKFFLPLPKKDAEEFHFSEARRRARSPEAALKAWEQSCRQCWRALNLVIKAKLEAVDAEITTFDEEFLAHIVLPGGTTTGDFFIPQLEKAYETGKLPALLPAHRKGSK